MPIQIHTKSGREAEIQKVLDAYSREYPKEFRHFKRWMQRQREVQKSPDGVFYDKKNRRMQIRMRAPTVLWLFLQHRIPDFGQDYRDVALLLKVGKDLVSTQRMKVRRVWSMEEKKEEKRESERGDARTPEPEGSPASDRELTREPFSSAG